MAKREFADACCQQHSITPLKGLNQALLSDHARRKKANAFRSFLRKKLLHIAASLSRSHFLSVAPSMSSARNIASLNRSFFPQLSSLQHVCACIDKHTTMP